MSWSESVAAMTRDELAAREPQSDQAKAAPDQYEAVRAAAVAIVDSGALGDPSTWRFQGGLSGHSNPDHVPTYGYANDSIYISLSQVAETPS